MMTTTSPLIQRRAGFSRCKSYRYWLSRDFQCGSGHCVFIGLNPSIGDANQDDPTIRRCMGFAADWGYRHLSVVNLFAYRTPDPTVLKKATAPEGPRNRQSIRRVCAQADCIVAAWGNHGIYRQQSEKLGGIWADLTMFCFGQTANKQPLHPLYQPKTALLQRFQL